MDACLKNLRTRSRFDEADQESMDLLTSKKMIALMTGLKSFKFDFKRISNEEKMRLIKTIINYCPLIKDLELTYVDEVDLEKLITKFGTKIKILILESSYLSDFKNREFQRSILEFLPNLEQLELSYCEFYPKILESIPSTLKMLSFRYIIHLNVINALINSNHSSSIECLQFDYLMLNDSN